MTIDDVMDLSNHIHLDRRDALPEIVGACEENTTGIHVYTQ